MPHRVIASRRRLVVAVYPVTAALGVVVVAFVVGCAPAEPAPRSRLGSAVAEPELAPATTTASADPQRRRVPDVIAPPKPFQLSDVAAGATGSVATMGREVEPLALPAPVRLASADVPEPAEFPADPAAAQAAPEMAEIRDMLTGYLQAFNRHDAAAAADHWTAAGENVNLASGEVTRGREAVREVFAALFELDAEATIDIDVSAIRPLQDDVAVVDGVSRVSYTDGEAAGSRFSAVVVRDQGRWRLASVRETPCAVAAAPARPLEALAWLVGSWENVGAGVTASGQCAWLGDRAFLTRHHLVSPGGTDAAPPAADARIPGLLPAGGTARRQLTEIIAWDPERETIRSWMFSSDGRFAEGTWSRDGDAWLVRVEGRGLDAGREATFRLSSDGPDSLVMQADGEALAGLLPPACGFTRTAR
ncbi:MAG: SgcJ/EcaC family oxidoreductase [Planctomycetota bacterium]